jgi:D-alanyl-D-alanine carboxypeptidase
VSSGLRRFALIGLFLSVFVFAAQGALAAPYAAMVMDARTGEVIHARNADTRLHPASLTKMMTLYIAFEAIENGEIGLDTMVSISRKAAAEPPSKLGLRAGQRVSMRHLIRAAALRSANDAATAIGEAIEGSEASFARRMNRTAQALGMTRTTFRNMHGLTQEGHLSTARDMTILGRHLFYDYPQYYNLFSRITTDAGLAEVANTNRRFLSAYRGADGIKTGFTRAAGFNLTASAERGGVRLIATVFGGASTPHRNAKMAELMDMGFARAPTRVSLRRPAKPPYLGRIGTTPEAPPPAAVVAGAVASSLRPLARPAGLARELPPEVILALESGINATLATLDLGEAQDDAAPVEVARAELTDLTPRPRPENAEDILLAAAVATAATPEPEREVVARLSSSGGRHWGINLGRFNTRHQAERILLQTALMELSTLDSALRKVVQTSRGFDANFVGMTEEQAALACRRLVARNLSCEALSPG